MVRKLSIFLLIIGFSLQIPVLKEWVKVPYLISHFVHYIQENGINSSLNFFREHYAFSTQHEDAAHQKLPFKSDIQPNSFNAYCINKANSAFTNITLPISAQTKTPIPYCTLLYKGALKSIFQPPRF